LLGIGTESECQAVQQGVLLLRRNGATLRIFDKTIQEMRRVLAVYQDHLRTAHGIRTLFKTPLTEYFLRTKASPGDVAQISAGLEAQLRQQDVRTQRTPDREAQFVLDESALESLLKSKDGRATGKPEPRVVHDVDCVAS